MLATPALLLAALAASAPPPFMRLPLSDGGLALDDLAVSPDGRFVVPMGESVALIAPDGGVSQRRLPPGAQPRRISSAQVAADGALVAADRQSRMLLLLENGALTSAPLAAGPDYVRIAGDQVWVTEPERHQIEIFRRVAESGKGAGRLEYSGVLPIPGEPESLVLDPTRNAAWTLTEDQGHLLRYALDTRAPVADFKIACPGRPKGLVVAGDLALIGCSAGAALAVALGDGKELGRLAVGQGVDIVAFDPARRRLYAPAGVSATLTIAAVGANGSLALLRSLPAVERGHCVAVSAGVAIVCDPAHGALLRYDDR